MQSLQGRASLPALASPAALARTHRCQDTEGWYYITSRRLRMSVQAKQIRVHGRVQGIGFRYFVQRAGNRLGPTGKVRNRPDDTVEIVVAGDAELISEFVREVTKGPPLSRVERLEIEDIAPVEGFRSFQIEGW